MQDLLKTLKILIVEDEKRLAQLLKEAISDSFFRVIIAKDGIEGCAAHKDLFNSEIVGYAAGNRITKELVIQSLLMAVRTKRPEPGLINHSDRGVQCCSSEYMKMLKQFGMIPSMSRKGNCL